MDWYDKRCLQNEVQEKANYWEIIVVLILVLSIFYYNYLDVQIPYKWDWYCLDH